MEIEQTENSESMIEQVSAYAKSREQEGFFPYEGQWLTLEEIKERIKRKKIDDRVIVMELCLLFGMVYVVSLACWLLLSVLAYSA